MCMQGLMKFHPLLLKILRKQNVTDRRTHGRTDGRTTWKQYTRPQTQFAGGIMKKIQLKMKGLECSQDFSHYKSMRIFPDAQGQLTPQSLVRSGRILYLSEMLWMSSLPASMKKIRSKMKALEWSQHYTAIFQTRKGRYLWCWCQYLAEIWTHPSFHACPRYLQE